jgi:hypothetical protein
MPVWRQSIRRRITSRRLPVGEEVSHRIGGIFMGWSGPILVWRESMSRHRGTRMQTFQERFYNFAKEAVAGTNRGGGDSPKFPVEVANRYYPEK